MIQIIAGPPSRRALLLHALSRRLVRPLFTRWPLHGPLARLLRLFDLLCWLPRLRGLSYEWAGRKHWRARLVYPHGGATRDGTVLYLHGGAFWFGGVHTHQRIVERLAQRTGMVVMSLDYRQLPKGYYDDSVGDCVDAYRWLLERDQKPSRIMLVGDSAGGHLTFAVALRLAQLGIEGPGGIAALSPWLDFDQATKEAHPNAARDAVIPAHRFTQLTQVLHATDRLDPTWSPVNGDLSVLPPVLMMAAEDEVLRVDAELMAERLDAAGVENVLQVWPGMVHAFPVLGHALPETRRALDVIAEFVFYCREQAELPAFLRVVA